MDRRLMRHPDEALMALVQTDGATGDGQAAFELLVYRYKDQLTTFVYRFLGSSPSCDDVVQDVFLRVFQSRMSYSAETARFSTWVYTIAANLAKSELRRRRPELFSALDRPGDGGSDGRVYEPVDETTPAPDASIEGESHDRQIQAALDRLNPVFREVVVLRDVQEMAYDEIAAVLDVSVGTVKSRLSRGRSQLQALLKGMYEQTSNR